MDTSGGSGRAAGPSAPHHDLDGEKTGTVLILSGLCLALIGITSTIMGWQRSKGSSGFEWTQLLGPVLVSVGGTFVLTSVCKLSLTSCRSRRRWEEEVTEQTPAGPSRGVNRPVVLRSAAATTLCLPPAYKYVARLQPGCSVSPALRPHPHVCGDNAAFTTDDTRGRTERTEDQGGHGARPPAYEDIYPSFHKHSPS